MHELALCDALLKMVRDISREEALDGVRSIPVRGGKKLMPLTGRDMTRQEIEAV